MTDNRRIALNIIATYGRSLYALVIGLVTARWVFLSLGMVDYGLVGAVGGLLGFVAFFNNLMASAVGRFYAYSIGETQKDGFAAVGLENCRHWFNVALLVHTVLPIILMLVGYPIGIWAVEHYLAIPPDRISACVWVWRFSCLACFVGMVSVPFAALYSAKQEIAELTIYGFGTTTLNAVFFYYMIVHPGSWLVRYSAWMCGMAVLPQLLICTTAWIRFPECRVRLEYLWDRPRLKELVVYVGSRFCCSLAQVFSNEGVAIAVNRILGPVRNSAMTVGHSVVGHTESLTASCVGALYPAITNAAGRGDYAGMRSLSYRMCKWATLAMIVFAFPLIPEMETVMKIWLKTPPEGAAGLCVIILIATVFNHMTDGHWMAIFALGKVTRFNVCESVGFFLAFGVAVVMMRLGFGIASAGYGILFGYLYAAVVKLHFGRTLCGLSACQWAQRVLVPASVIGMTGLAVGFLPRFFTGQSVERLLLSAGLTLIIVFSLVWLVGLDSDERAYIVRWRKSLSFG